MSQWDGQGEDPAGDQHGDYWQDDGTGYNDQFSLDDPHDPHDPRTSVPDNTEHIWYGDDYHDYDNYTAAGSLAPLTTSFPDSGDQAPLATSVPDSGGHAPLATPHQKSGKHKDKRSQGKEARHNERRDDGRSNQKNKRPAADKRPPEKKGAKQETKEKHDAGKKGKKPATADEVEQMEMQNLGFGGLGNDADIPFGDETYGLSNHDPFYQDDAAAMTQGIANSMTALDINTQPLQGESSASGGAYDAADGMDPYQPDGTLVESQWGSKKKKKYPAPKSSHTNQNHNLERYKSHDWKLGHMLLIWWTEPKGTKDSTWTTKRKAPDNSWEGWRRFMIVSRRNSDGNSKCVPVTTYQGQGTTQNKKPEHHGVVYNSTHHPVLAPKEPVLGYKPIAVDMFDEYETLHEYSRINYNKIQTIEHNLLCRFIGKVSDADLDQYKANAQATHKW